MLRYRSMAPVLFSTCNQIQATFGVGTTEQTANRMKADTLDGGNDAAKKPPVLLDS